MIDLPCTQNTTAGRPTTHSVVNIHEKNPSITELDPLQGLVNKHSSVNIVGSCVIYSNPTHMNSGHKQRPVGAHPNSAYSRMKYPAAQQHDAPVTRKFEAIRSRDHTMQRPHKHKCGPRNDDLTTIDGTVQCSNPSNSIILIG